MNNSDDKSNFQKIRTLITSPSQIKLIPRFIIGSVVLFVTFKVVALISDFAYRDPIKNRVVWEKYAQYHPIIDLVWIVVTAAVVGWMLFGLFSALAERARDRVLRREIEQERQWRLREWESGMYGDSAPPSYLLTDAGEIESAVYQSKRKRIEM